MSQKKCLNKYVVWGFGVVFLLLLVVVTVVVVRVYFPGRPAVVKERRSMGPADALRPVDAPLLADHGDTGPLVTALQRDLDYFGRLSGRAGDPMAFGPKTITYARVRDSITDFKGRLETHGLTEAFFRYLRRHYHFFESTAGGDVLFTGYYEASLRGSPHPSKRYRYPLYMKPQDLFRVDLAAFDFYGRDGVGKIPKGLYGRLDSNRTIVPYYTREEIDSRQKLVGRGLEIAWIDNPIDVFFLHIQGSGIVTFPGGETMRVNYAGANGHPYRAIGRLLIDRNIISRENMSMQSIRRYLAQHPGEMEEVFNYNPSYVFFRVVEDGPMGALGVPVTAFRSIAVDTELFPAGAIGYIETEIPVFDEHHRLIRRRPYSGFVLSQDRGGAIRGNTRVDLFTGYGEQSERVAGHMKEHGRLYFLIKKQPKKY